MSSTQSDRIRKILDEVDDLLRRRLEEAGITVAHLALAVDDDGVGVIRSNCGPDQLQVMALVIDDVAKDSVTARGHPLN